MNKKGSALVVIFILLIIIAAVYALVKYSDFDLSGIIDRNKGNNSVQINDTLDECPKIVCNVSDFPPLDSVAYYFDNDTYKGLNVFMDNSKSYIHCAFTSLNSQNYASQFIALKNAGIDVKIQFGIEDSMISCETLCVPKLDSQYNYLLGEGVSVDYSRINFNFCVNEKAVYVFSLLPGDIQRQDYGLIIFNTELRDSYERYFESIFN